MGRQNIEFKNSDGVTLRGWFYTPDKAPAGKLPTLVMAHGFTALKEMTLDSYAEAFTTSLPINCLVYDHRGFGESDNLPGQPRGELVPMLQISDYSDAITYAATRPETNADKIGIWGTSYSGGHVLMVAAIDRRVKVVLSQGPCVSGWDNFHRLVRPDLIPQLEEAFAAGMYNIIGKRSLFGCVRSNVNTDRIGRLQGKEATYIPIVHKDLFGSCALNGKDVYDFFYKWEKKTTWKNTITLRR